MVIGVLLNVIMTNTTPVEYNIAESIEQLPVEAELQLIANKQETLAEIMEKLEIEDGEYVEYVSNSIQFSPPIQQEEDSSEQVVEEELIEEPVVSEMVKEVQDEIPQVQEYDPHPTDTGSAKNGAIPDESIYDIEYAGNFYITGYDPWCKHCCSKTDGITSSGAMAEVGWTVANNHYKTGTLLYLEGYGIYCVQDTGAMPGQTIDMACSCHDECYAITGHTNVYVLRLK